MNQSYRFYAFTYAGFYLLVLVVVLALGFVITTFVPGLAERLTDGGGVGGLSIASLIVPVMLVAQRFHKHEERQTSRKEGWFLAVSFLFMSFAVSALLMFGLQMFVGAADVSATDLIAFFVENSDIFFFVLIGYSVFLILINRLILWSSIRSEIRRKERLAAKAAREG